MKGSEARAPGARPCAGAGPCARRRRILLAAASTPLWLIPALARGAEDPGDLEHRVKAAFLFKFAGYVDWPPASFARPDSPITIAVMGAEAVATELVRLSESHSIQDRPVQVKRLKPGESLAGVHILFVGGADGERVEQVAASARPRSILTVTESDGALERGSVINFLIVSNRVRFEISLDSAEKSKLRLSSRLLAVAQQVRKGNP